MLLLVSMVLCQNDQDRVQIPGYDQDYKPKSWSGYLNTSSQHKRLFYIFTESQSQGDNPGQDPVTLWLNGGPGCSSMLGFLQQVGPYYMQDGVDYKKDDKLIRNNYSWAKVSNMLFIESPAGVGFSINQENNKQINDSITAKDMLQSLLSWRQKFPQFENRSFWITGQSYAGKYIPDLARQIDFYNQNNPTSMIPLKGMLIGNGVITFKDNSLQKSSIQYFINHQFLSPQSANIYHKSCQNNMYSPQCLAFLLKYSAITKNVNPYQIYGYCFTSTKLVDHLTEHNKQEKFGQAQALYKALNSSLKDKSAPCAYFDGVYHYFSLNKNTFHATSSDWYGPCANIKYQITKNGSVDQLRYLIFRQKYRIVLYNGDWDAVVPYIDTLKNIPELYINPIGQYNPWFVEDQHAGFKQDYTNNVSFITIKGASHQVPQSRRAAALAMLKAQLNR